MPGAPPKAATPKPTPTSSAPTATTPVPTTSSPTTSSPSGTPAAFRNVSMTGGGVSITFPNSDDDGWDVSRSEKDGRSWTDVTLGGEVPAPVDLTARGIGTARDGAESPEASIRPERTNYTRLGIPDVAGVGDDAVDCPFRYDEDGTAARVIDRQIQSGPGGVAVLLRAPAASYDRYLPVWKRVITELNVRTS